LRGEYPYNVGAKSINGDWFTLPMEEVWEIMSEQLHFIHHAFQVRIHAFVLMSNHFHLIVTTPKSNLSEAMCWFMRETSRTLTRAGNRINQTYGGRHFRSVMKSHNYYLNAYKYLYFNPVHAGMVRSVLDYPYSTLHNLLGRRRLLIPVVEDLTLFNDVTGTLNWLDRIPTQENWEAVDKAIHRKVFKFAKQNNRAHPLENDTL
jgi:putative transposase